MVRGRLDYVNTEGAIYFKIGEILETELSSNEIIIVEITTGNRGKRRFKTLVRLRDSFVVTRLRLFEGF